MDSAEHPYVGLVVARAAPTAAQWFERKYATLDLGSFAVVYAGAGRRLGVEPADVSDETAAELRQRDLLVPLGWPLCDIGRSALLHRAVTSLAVSDPVRFIDDLYQKGDSGERAALLRTLAMVPEPERFVATAIDACRSHVQSVFEAIACENPYPARHFPEQSFNQLVLKAFFTEVRVERIWGLEARRTAELVRMANDYASERRAAGRAVPADLKLVTEGA